MATRNARSLLQYWAHPYLADGTRHPLPLTEWLGWIGLMLVLALLGSGIAWLAVHMLGHPWPANRAIEQLLAHPTWGVALFVLCEPVLEELVFRAFMTRETKVMSLGLGFVFATLVLVVVGLFMGRHVAHRDDLIRAYFEQLAVLVSVALALAVLVFTMRKVLLRGLIAAAPAWIVLMTLLFASVHALNFEQGLKPWLLWMTMPQLLVALVLVYLRIRHGLRWSIATHLAFDWLVLGFAWLSFGVKTTGGPGHAPPMQVGLALLALLALFVLFVYGAVFLFRRGVLRPLPEAR